VTHADVAIALPIWFQFFASHGLGAMDRELIQMVDHTYIQSVRFVVNDRGLFITGWFGVKEKYYFSL